LDEQERLDILWKERVRNLRIADEEAKRVEAARKIRRKYMDDEYVSFYDLDPEERAYWTSKAEEETGQEFYDLSPEERGYWYDRAEQTR
jgi:hypothetical protein